ncbi:Fungal lipase-like domain containing protein [Parasponia andersonii]|uniref:Phospholipase A1 n=1 Tax=Parasponia andersonii TaxID=3476 RepID=A0A2P5ASV0_PARAD|nr:Fungal lipase-like domain containing protein [Parasponia andersonii]
MSTSSINPTVTSPTWEEPPGSNNWNGLLEPPPMNLVLRKFVLRCGNFAEAIYDVFDNDLSVYPSANSLNEVQYSSLLTQGVCLENGKDYQVVSFLYAVSGLESLLPNYQGDRISNWMGFVAVTNDQVSTKNGRREIYVAWRGTVRDSEWVNNADAIRMVSIDPLLTPQTDRSLWRPSEDGEPRVHSGFLKAYTTTNGGSSDARPSAKDEFGAVIQNLKTKYLNEKLSIIVTGHSLGGSLATLSAFDLVANGIRNIPVTVVAFNCPGDAVPSLLVMGSFYYYVPVRTTKLEVDIEKSPKLKKTLIVVINPRDKHGLEVLLHVVDGWNGPDNEFDPKVNKSLALVNKWTGMLRGTYFP